MPRPPRNAPCPCGSGKKYKRCCMVKVLVTEQAMREYRRIMGEIKKSKKEKHGES
jgi:hypothetical protein